MKYPKHIERALERWEALGRELLTPDLELDTETFAPLCATFQQLKRAGVRFDTTLSNLMTVLKAQGLRNQDDSEAEFDHDHYGLLA
jgi:hypothetical protein